MTATSAARFLCYRVGNARFGIAGTEIERVTRAAEVTLLPGAPETILGIIDYQGTLVPVVSMRRKFGWPEPGVRATDCFVIGVDNANRRLALAVDGIEALIECGVDSLVEAATVMPHMPIIRQVAKLADGLVLLHSFQGLLTQEEAATVDAIAVSEGKQ